MIVPANAVINASDSTSERMFARLAPIRRSMAISLVRCAISVLYVLEITIIAHNRAMTANTAMITVSCVEPPAIIADACRIISLPSTAVTPSARAVAASRSVTASISEGSSSLTNSSPGVASPKYDGSA